MSPPLKSAWNEKQQEIFIVALGNDHIHIIFLRKDNLFLLLSKTYVINLDISLEWVSVIVSQLECCNVSQWILFMNQMDK